MKAGLKWIAVATAAVLLGYLVWANVREVRGEPVTTGEAPYVMTMPVSRGTLIDRVVAPAAIQAADMNELRSPFASARIDVLVEVGDSVREGDVLVQLNTDELMSEIREQEAAVIRARNDLDQALRDAELRPEEERRQLEAAQRRVEEAETGLAEAREQGDEAIRQAQADLAAAEAALAAATENPELEEARLAAEAAMRRWAANPEDADLAAAYEQAQSRYEQLESQSLADARAAQEAVIRAREELQQAREERERRVEQAQIELEDARFALDKLKVEQAAQPSTDPVEAARQSLTAAEEALAALQRQLEDAEVRSPIDGVVLALQVDDDQAVNAGTQLLSVGRLDEVEVQLRVDEADIAKLAEGQPLTLRTPAFPGRQFEGTITDVPLQAGSGSSGGYYGPGSPSTFFLTGLVQNPEGSLRVGMNAEAEIITTRREGVVLIGLEALRQEGQPHVFVLDGDVARRRDVMPGATSRTQVEIREGLNEGDILITGPFPTLKELEDGQEVRTDQPQGGNAAPMRGVGK